MNRSDISHLIFNATPSLLPFGHRVVGSHQQIEHKKAQQTNKNTKTIRKNEGTLNVTGIWKQVLKAEKETKHEKS